MDAATRNFVRERAGDRCEYCRLPGKAAEWPFHVEHIIAKQHGGDDRVTNHCWSCSRCNLYKGTNLASIDPETGAYAELYHPRRQAWHDHFAFSDASIEGRSGPGRATAKLLRMNDDLRLELRRQLIKSGQFGD